MEIYYKREHSDDRARLEPLDMPNCGQKCPLDKLFELYQDDLPTEDFETITFITYG